MGSPAKDPPRRAGRQLIAGAAVAVALLLSGTLPATASATVEAPNVCLDGTPSTGWCGDGDAAVDARLASPGSIVALPDGAFAFADMLNGAVREVTANGTIRTLATIGSGEDGCPPGQIALAPDGRLLVAAPGCARVVAVSAHGSSSLVAGEDPAAPTADQPLRAPTGVAIAPGGAVLIADAGRILRLGADGVPHALRLHPRIHATTLLTLPGGRVLAAGETAGVIWRVNPATGATHVVLGHPRTRRVGGDLIVTRYDRAVGAPAAMTVAPDGGFTFADLLHGRIQRVGPGGHVRTVAGTGRAGFSGDGGPALAARLSRPAGVALRADGGLLIADAGNDRIRLVSPADGTIATVAGSGQPPSPDDIAVPRRGTDPGTGSGGPCLGCATTDYRRLFNYFHFHDVPIFARHGRSIVVHLATSRSADVVVSVARHGHVVRTVHAHVGTRGSAVRIGSFPPGRYAVAMSGSAGGARLNAGTTTLIVR